MQIERVRIKNFKKIRQLDETVGRRLTVVVGPNYSGKTTLRQAIGFALFGASAVPKGNSAIKTVGTSSPTIVEVFLKDGEDSIIVRRTLSSAQVTENGEVTVTSPSAVTRYCSEILGCDLKMFQILYSIDAEEMFSILTLGSAKLTHMIEQVVHADVVDHVIAQCTGLRAQNETRVSILEPELVKLEQEKKSVEQLELELAPLVPKIKLLSSEVQTAHEEHTRLRKQADTLRARRDAYLSYKAEYESALERETFLRHRIAELKEQAKEADKLSWHVEEARVR